MATVDEARQKVQRILASEFNGVMLNDDAFALRHGSTMVRISVHEFGKDPQGNPASIVHVWAPLAREVEPTPEFYEWVATEGQRFLFGHVSLMKPEGQPGLLVSFDHALLADYLDPAELVSTIMAMAAIADDLDETMKSRFGGKRYAD